MHVEGNLFEYEDTPLAHCVSVDLVMGAGIALEFKNKFQGKDEVRRQSLLVGSAGVLYLVTKEKVSDIPTYNNLKKCLVALRGSLSAAGWKRLAIPRIGSGIDKLKWQRVEDVIQEVFAGSGVTITDVSLPSPRVSEVQLTSCGTSLTIPCVLNGREVEGVVDTAAQITVMSRDCYKSLQNPPELETSLTIKGAGSIINLEEGTLKMGGASSATKMEYKRTSVGKWSFQRD
jgi:hypothetical protein